MNIPNIDPAEKVNKETWGDRIQVNIRRLLKRLPIGARVFKSTLALVVSMLLGELLGIGSIFTSSSALWGMQPTMGESISGARKMLRMQFLSFIPTFLLGLTIGPNLVSISIAVLMIFQMGIKFKMTGQVTIGIASAIFILSSPTSTFLRQATLRSIGVLIGLIVAILINRFIAPPRYRDSMVLQGIALNRLLMSNFRKAVEAYMQETPLSAADCQAAEEVMHKEIAKFDKLYNHYKTEQGIVWEDEGGAEEKQNLEHIFFGEYRDYCHDLMMRTKENWSLTQEKERRLRRWKEEVPTALDQSISRMVGEALNRMEECNDELIRKITGGPPLPFENPHVWKEMDKLLLQWHSDSGQSRHDLHHLVEISLVIYRIRWSLKNVLDLLIMEPCQMAVVSPKEVEKGSLQTQKN